jgi:hypothetical protein
LFFCFFRLFFFFVLLFVSLFVVLFVYLSHVFTFRMANCCSVRCDCGPR